MFDTILVTTPPNNPDLPARLSKATIDISTATSDISSSNYGGIVQLNYQNDEVKIYVDSDNEAVTYYTPIYNEKIDYSTWKIYVNKSFQELSAL